MSAPNVNAVGENSEAAYLASACSSSFVEKKIYLGRIEEKSRTGATIEANLELEKNTAISILNVTSDIENVTK